MIHLILTVKDRLDLTQQTLDSLRPTLPEKAKIWCIDNGSQAETRAYLKEQKGNGTLHYIAYNKPGSVPQWEKCCAIVQAWKAVKGEIKTGDYVGWIDNDMKVGPNWTSIPQRVLTVPFVDICSLHNDPFQETKHATQRIEQLEGLAVRIKKTANGAFWIMRHDFFDQHGLPPVGLGPGREGVEDWHYSRVLMRKKRFFGIVDGVSEHLGYNSSMRKRIRKWRR